MNMLTVIFMVFIAGVFFLFLRAEMCKVKGRKLAEKKPVFSEKNLEEFSEDRQVYYRKKAGENDLLPDSIEKWGVSPGRIL